MGILYILKNKKNLNIFIILNIFFSLLYFFIKNTAVAISSFSIPIFSFSQKFTVFIVSFFDISELRDIKMLVLVIFLLFSLSLFCLLSYLLWVESKKINKKNGLINIFLIFISVLGLSCASCGIGLLASLFSFFSLSSLIVYFPLHGLELGYIGVLAINISNYFLLKRLKNPYTC